MRRRTLIGVIASTVGVLLAFAMLAPASAAPAGAATNLSFGSCQTNGAVSGTLSWNPSGLGSQYVDLAVDPGFNSYSRGGPYSNSASSVRLTQLETNRTYYARVLTVTSSGTLASDVITVSQATCGGGGSTGGAITKPTNVTATALSNGNIRVSWTRGNNNSWFCVDTARSLTDLYNISNTWRNHGCWTTGTSLTVSNVLCGQTYYVLVYAWNPTSSVKSDPTVVTTASCQSPISAPANLSVTSLGADDYLVDWSAGTGNIWYCVDTALSQSDLLNLTDTWSNHGCWTTSTQLVISGLECDETYYYLVYSWNYNSNVKSSVRTFESDDCKPHIELAPIEDVDVAQGSGDNYVAEITAALPNGCHEPDSHRVQRFGDTIEITVWNSVEPGPCTEIFSTYELSVNLGSNFEQDEDYTVVVNDDESDTFTYDPQ